jgi:hypothetical protein
MKKSEFTKIIEKWTPVIEKLEIDPVINIDKLSKNEKLCLYAHIHFLLENSSIENDYMYTGNDLHILRPPFNITTNKILSNQSTLAMSLKILKKIEKWDNIIIVESPYNDYKNYKITVKNIEFTKDVSELLTEDEISLDDISQIENIIITTMNEYFDKIIEENIDKKIFIYIVVQSISIMKTGESKILLWRSKLSINLI